MQSHRIGEGSADCETVTTTATAINVENNLAPTALLDGESLEEYVARTNAESRRAQGLPPGIQDPTVLQRLRTLAAASTSPAGRAHAA
jgi:hypothetical protein